MPRSSSRRGARNTVAALRSTPIAARNHAPAMRSAPARRSCVCMPASPATCPTTRSPSRWSKPMLPGGHAPGLLRDAQLPAAGRGVQLAQRSRVVPGLPRVLHGARARAPVVRPGGGLEELSRAVVERGFAQYFAALFAKEKRGEPAFRDILRQFRKWAIEDLDQGPVYLGYRLGHIRGDSRTVPRAGL